MVGDAQEEAVVQHVVDVLLRICVQEIVGHEGLVEVAFGLGHAVEDAAAARLAVGLPVAFEAFLRTVRLAVAAAAALEWLVETGVGFLADAACMHGTSHGLVGRKLTCFGYGDLEAHYGLSYSATVRVNLGGKLTDRIDGELNFRPDRSMMLGLIVDSVQFVGTKVQVTIVRGFAVC